MDFFYYQIDYNRLQFLLILIDSIVTKSHFYVHFFVQIIYRFYTDFLQIKYTLSTDYIPYKIYFNFVPIFIEKISKKTFVTCLVLMKITKIDKKQNKTV